MKKIIAMLLSAILAVGVLSGCGGSSGAASAAGSAAGKGSKSNTAATKLELFSTKTENAEILKTLAAEYTKDNPNVTITVTAQKEAGTVLKTRLTKNEIPDVIAMGGDATYTELESAGVLEDLGGESYVDTVQDSYKQMVYDVNKDKEKKLYGVPYATNASGVLYNKDMFKEVGVQVPKTWDDFINVIKKLKEAGKQPLEFTFKDSWTCLCPWNSIAPILQPENFLDDKLAGKTTFANTHKEVAQKYLELLKYAQKDYMGTSYDDGNKAFAQGKAAMMINGNWAISEFKKTNKDFNVGLFALPASNDTSKNKLTSGVDVLFAVGANSAVKDTAKDFVAYMVKKETAQKYIDDQFAFSAIKGAVQKDASVEDTKQDIADGKVINFPDHYYPSGFELKSLVQEFAKNAVNNMDEEKNITQFLNKCDKAYDTANVE